MEKLEDGNYWIYDCHLYGWEVVRVSGGYFRRIGNNLSYSVDDSDYEFIFINEPESL